MDISYQQLRQWRDLCEFLDGCYYKCAKGYEIKAALPGNEVWCPAYRVRRRQLWDNLRIQFTKYGNHPKAYYTGGKSKWQGYILLPHWEHKINYLEHLVLFGKEVELPWVPVLDAILSERIHDQAKEELSNYLNGSYPPSQGLVKDDKAEIRERRRNLSYIEKLKLDEEWIANRVLEIKAELEEKEQRRSKLIEQGLCPYCCNPIITLMMDCSCGAAYDWF